MKKGFTKGYWWHERTIDLIRVEKGCTRVGTQGLGTGQTWDSVWKRTTSQGFPKNKLKSPNERLSVENFNDKLSKPTNKIHFIKYYSLIWTRVYFSFVCKNYVKRKSVRFLQIQFYLVSSLSKSFFFTSRVLLNIKDGFLCWNQDWRKPEVKRVSRTEDELRKYDSFGDQCPKEWIVQHVKDRNNSSLRY